MNRAVEGSFMLLKNSASTSTNQQMDVFDTRYLQINKLLLSYIGLWPMQSNRNTIFICFTILGLLSMTLPQIAFLFTRLRDLSDFYDILPTLMGSFICTFKSLGLHWQNKKFKILLQHVRQDWCLLMKHKDIWILMEYSEKSRMFTLLYLIVTTVGIASFVAIPLMIPLFDLVFASNVTRSKRLPHPAEFFVDTEKYYYILLTIMFASYVVCVLIIVACDTIYVVLLQHTCGILTMLSNRLKKWEIDDKLKYVRCNPVSKGDKDIENIVQCIQLQVRTERLIELIESTFAICLFIDFGFGILLQCSSCVMIVFHTDVIKNCVLLFIQTSRLFFNYWMGQRLLDHNFQISIAAYNGMWYEMSLKAKKVLLFLMMKCQKPCYITVAKIYVICMQSYSTLMRTSASYVTLMISLNSDDV
ncbi:odorant receptor Or2 [Monomorium pharaonis]|uniref:odorant receptor Or2 n=1 Tax=Monomorium pharaonis TaxID=307658 RepID=UPI00102E11C7|nr:odorant receptor Or2 [Monomorium pharaonis]